MRTIDEVNDEYNRNAVYDEEIYYKCISQSRDANEAGEDNDTHLQNRIIMNNFISGNYESNRRLSTISFSGQKQENEAHDKKFQVYRKSPLFPKVL